MISARLLLSVLVAVFVPACSIEPQSHRSDIEANPALWRVSDEDTTLYIFGTVHVLPNGVNWRNEAFMGILDEVNLIYVERHLPSSKDDLARTTALISPIDGQDMRDLLSAEEYRRVAEAWPDNIAPIERFHNTSLWYTAMQLSLAAMDDDGISSHSGVEAWLTNFAKAKRIDVRGLERLSEAPELFSALPIASQKKLLLTTVEEMDTMNVDFQPAFQAWIAGEIDALHATTMAEMAREFPLVYEAIIVQRNKNWVEDIETILATERGEILIAVGASHLAGPQSMIPMLEAEGLTVERF